MTQFILIFLGSGLGGVLRHWAGRLIQAWSGTSFPLGTMAVNVTGCLGIGFFAVALSGPIVREDYRVAILVGVFGGYTTFSTFGRETMSLIHDGEWTLAGSYIVLTNLVAILALWFGTAVGTKCFGQTGL